MKPEPLGAPIDARGRRVRKSLSGPFIARARLHRMAGVLQDIKSELLLMQHYERVMDSLPTERIHAALDELRNLLIDNSPAVVCECHSGSSCPICEDRRWLSAAHIRRIADTKSPVQSPGG